MTTSKDIQKYKGDIVRISYDNYQKEIFRLNNIPFIPVSVYEEYILTKLNDMNGLVYLEEGKCSSYILYNEWEEQSGLHVRIPEWGYGSDNQEREKTIGYLFQLLAEEKVKETAVNFSIDVYAHDLEIQRLFSFMEFGMQAETGIRILEKTDSLSEVKVRELYKEELADRWTEIWKLLEQLINHLKKSPVFYFGEEFTEDVYREFFSDAGTRVYIAEEGREIIGLIQSNEDNMSPIFADKESANVGEVFVLPEYRRKNIAQALLNYACDDLLQNEYRYAWVEHGTANPNARYFWNKYFVTYKYEMTRTIGK